MPHSTTSEDLDRCLRELSAAKERHAATTAGERRRLVGECLAGVFAVADDWVAAARGAKGPPDSAALAAEEFASGPIATVRYLQVLQTTLGYLEANQPALPAPFFRADGRLCFQLNSREHVDAFVFRGLHAHAVMQPGITGEIAVAQRGRAYRAPRPPGKVALVLGAGNVTSIPALDTFSKLFESNSVVLLKVNPVNEYIGPILQRALAALIGAGCLRIIYGGADVGAAAIADPRVDEVHITGSIHSHDAIVWGPPAERAERMRTGKPLLAKPITSELGNVSPWIIVPGRYTRRQLQFQAENVAASIVNNASFNCVATKMIVTARDWPDREPFLNMIRDILARTPWRRAYYPGAPERFARFAGAAAGSDERGTLPWVLRTDVDPAASPDLFAEESFVSVTAETALDATSPADFLNRAADFVNDSLWGTLSATLTVPDELRRDPAGGKAFEDAILRLRYGAVGVNQWTGLAYALAALPWGGYPGAGLNNIQSGLGWVHNPYLLEGVEKCVLSGPLTLWPKPIWFPTHRRPEPVARRLLEFYEHKSLWRLGKLGLAAART